MHQVGQPEIKKKKKKKDSIAAVCGLFRDCLWCVKAGSYEEPDNRADFSGEGHCKKAKSKNNSLHAYFTLVFLLHRSFSFQGRMET